jgi:peptidoglycan/LPS O-acetylase OafA/YrhL
MTTQSIVMLFVGAALSFVAATLAGQAVAALRFPVPQQSKRIGCVDGLRGYLAMSVFVYHFCIWVQPPQPSTTWYPPSVNALAQFGSSGVALFFMASGLVFYPKILAGIRGVSWPALYISRVFRIVPLIAASTLLITLIIAWRTGARPDAGFPRDVFKWLIAWAQVPLLGEPEAGRLNAYVLWSIWFEWLFYIFVVPACAAAIELMRGRLPSWILPVALFVTCQTLVVAGYRWSILPHLPVFAVGMIAYECQQRVRLAAFLRSPAVTVLSAAALLLAVVTTPTPYGVAMPAFALFFVCVACGNSFWGVFASRGALVLGECSYGVYLMHGIVLSLLFTEGGRLLSGWQREWLPLLMPFAAIAVVLVTALAHLAIERPAIRMGHVLARWVSRCRRPAANAR